MPAPLAAIFNTPRRERVLALYYGELVTRLNDHGRWLLFLLCWRSRLCKNNVVVGSSHNLRRLYQSHYVSTRRWKGLKECQDYYIRFTTYVTHIRARFDVVGNELSHASHRTWTKASSVYSSADLPLIHLPWLNTFLRPILIMHLTGEFNVIYKWVKFVTKV